MSPYSSSSRLARFLRSLRKNSDLRYKRSSATKITCLSSLTNILQQSYLISEPLHLDLLVLGTMKSLQRIWVKHAVLEAHQGAGVPGPAEFKHHI